LALYILCYQLAYNLESVTGWAFGLTSMQRIFLLGDISTLEGYLIFVMVLLVVLISLLMFFKQTYLYTILQWRWEREVILRALGVWVSRYKLIMIILTTLLAVIGGNLYGFYYLYIDPPSFWLPMLILLLVVVFVSYRFNEIGTFLVALVILGAYEWLRFFKIVDPSKIGYLREIIFALIIMIATFRVFRTTKFWRSA
jgi:ABC-type branched-subunit amino acid transport system permease subunit